MAKLQSAQHTKETKGSSEDILGQVEVRPRRMGSINLGMYEQGMPEPTLTVELKPNSPDTIERLTHATRSRRPLHTYVISSKTLGT
jgi:hypothetical protein